MENNTGKTMWALVWYDIDERETVCLFNTEFEADDALALLTDNGFNNEDKALAGIQVSGYYGGWFGLEKIEVCENVDFSGYPKTYYKVVVINKQTAESSVHVVFPWNRLALPVEGVTITRENVGRRNTLVKVVVAISYKSMDDAIKMATEAVEQRVL